MICRNTREAPTCSPATTFGNEVDGFPLWVTSFSSILSMFFVLVLLLQPQFEAYARRNGLTCYVVYDILSIYIYTIMLMRNLKSSLYGGQYSCSAFCVECMLHRSTPPDIKLPTPLKRDALKCVPYFDDSKPVLILRGPPLRFYIAAKRWILLCSLQPLTEINALAGIR
ncbi:hypothetical protein CI102_10263 [Trichoderma harzianum]|nr:hypothetical protein CI102_10263 [Trichoderma harzianum]